MKFLIYIGSLLILISGIALWPYHDPPVSVYELTGIVYGYLYGGVMVYLLTAYYKKDKE